jgi:hypothetical protein
MSKARDLASAAPAPSTVSATELGYVDGVTSAIQTQLDAKTAKSTLTTTGDIYYASAANTPARLGIGSTGNVLTVASGIPSWAAPAGGGGPTFQATQSLAQQTFSAGTFTKLQYDTEAFDPDSCYDSTTNYRFTANKSGYYLVNAAATIYRQAGGSAGTYILQIRKNGTNIKYIVQGSGETSLPTVAGSLIVFLNGTSDYIEIFGYGDGGGSTQTSDGGTAATQISLFQASFLRS